MIYLIKSLKVMIMCLFMSYSNRKMINLDNDKKNKILILMYIIIAILHAFISMAVQTKVNTTIFTVICVSIVYTVIYKFKIMYSILISTISISINQIIWFVSAAISYFFIRILK